MNVPVIEYTMEYFLNECMRRDHIWLTNCRASISTNGLLYFAESNMDNTPTYNKKWDEASELWIKLDNLKRAIEKKYKPAGDWDSYEFDFDNNQVVFVKNG